MKRILMISTVVAALSGGPVPALAGGIPTIDVANLAEAVKDGLTQGQQLAELKNQYEQLIQQYNQAVANARRLGNLDELLDLEDFVEDLLEGSATEVILQEIHGLDPRSPTFKSAAKSILHQEYGLRESDEEMRARVEALYDPETAERVLDRYGRTTRDYDQVLGGASIITREQERQADLKDNLLSYRETLSGLGDDSLLATVQLQAKQDQDALVQRDIELNYLALQAQMSEAAELRRLEREQALQEEEIRRAEAAKAFQLEPINQASERLLK